MSSPQLMTLEQAQDLFPDSPPSTRWISKTAKDLGCYVKVGRRVYITDDFLEKLRSQWPTSASTEPKTAARSTTSGRGSRSASMTVPSSGEILSEALELAQSPKPETPREKSKLNTTSGRVVQFPNRAN